MTSAKTLSVLSVAAYAVSQSGFILYSKFLVTKVDVPLFIAFAYSVFSAVAWTSALVALYCSGAQLRILTPKALPLLAHVSGILQALSVGMWTVSIRESDPVVFFSLVGLHYVFLMILPMFFRVQFRLSYNFGVWKSVGLGLWLVLSSVLIVTNNPQVEPAWAVIIVMTVGVYSADYFFKLKLLLDYKLSPECIVTYTTYEAVIWLFGMAFVLDMGVVLEMKDFDLGIGWIALGALVYFLFFLSTFQYIYKTPREERYPYAYQISWALLVISSPFIFGISVHPLHIAGIVMTFIGSAAIEYLETKSRPPPLGLGDERTWQFLPDVLTKTNLDEADKQ